MTVLDTGFLFALVSKKDAHHARVVEVFRAFRNVRLADHLLTTNHVIAETITLCAGSAFAISENGSHHPWVAVPVENRHDPHRLLVCCVRNEILIPHDVKPQRSLRQVRASMSNVR